MSVTIRILPSLDGYFLRVAIQQFIFPRLREIGRLSKVHTWMIMLVQYIGRAILCIFSGL